MSNVAVIPTNMFSENMHVYHITFDGTVVSLMSPPEQQEFNAFTQMPVNQIEGEDLVYAAVLGNQHPAAVLKNLVKPNWTLSDLTDFSAFTIGDLVVATSTKVYFCVGGSVQITDLTEQKFEAKRGTMLKQEA